MTGDRSLDHPVGQDDEPPGRWDEAREWIADSAASVWSGTKRFVRAQLRSGRKLTLWVVLVFAVATFAVAWMVAGTASAPTGCEGLQAITESECT